MTRFQGHVAVEDFDPSIRFYPTLFAAEPTVRKLDDASAVTARPSCDCGSAKAA